jgi:thioredoxin 1
MLTVKRYSASWCQPCKQLAPIFTELQNEITNVIFETIDVDVDRNAALENGISSVPTVVLEKNGTQVYRFTGVLPKPTIVGIINKYL